MANNDKYTKHTRHIYRRVYFVRNIKKFNMKNIDWFEGDLKLADIATTNAVKNDLNIRIKYTMVSLDN